MDLKWCSPQVDLALGHVAALRRLEDDCGYCVYNLGSGQGFSVLEIVKVRKYVTWSALF